MLRKHILFLIFALNKAFALADCHEETHIVDLFTKLLANWALGHLDFFVHVELPKAFFDPNFPIVSLAFRVLASAFQVQSFGDLPPFLSPFWKFFMYGIFHLHAIKRQSRKTALLSTHINGLTIFYFQLPNSMLAVLRQICITMKKLQILIRDASFLFIFLQYWLNEVRFFAHYGGFIIKLYVDP